MLTCRASWPRGTRSLKSGTLNGESRRRIAGSEEPSGTIVGRMGLNCGRIANLPILSAAALAAGKEKKKAAETKKSVKVRAVHSYFVALYAPLLTLILPIIRLPQESRFRPPRYSVPRPEEHPGLEDDNSISSPPFFSRSSFTTLSLPVNFFLSSSTPKGVSGVMGFTFRNLLLDETLFAR